MQTPMTIRDHLERARIVYGDRVGIYDEPDQPAPSLGDLTYGQFYDLAQGMAASKDEGNEFTKGLDPDMFVRFLDTPERVVLEFTPEMSIPFDGDKMAQGTAAAYAAFARENQS